MKRKKGFYSISVVAKMFSVHQQTIRMYEKQGLINPKRSTGNTHLFAEEDVDRLEEVIYLTHKLGVNLAGVEIILKQQRQIKRLQGEMNKLFKSVEGDFEKDTQEMRDAMRKNMERLVEIKKENSAKKHENLIEIGAPMVDEMRKRPQGGKKKKAAEQAKQLALPTFFEEPEAFEDDIEIEYEK